MKLSFVTLGVSYKKSGADNHNWPKNHFCLPEFLISVSELSEYWQRQLVALILTQSAPQKLLKFSLNRVSDNPGLRQFFIPAPLELRWIRKTSMQSHRLSGKCRASLSACFVADRDDVIVFHARLDHIDNPLGFFCRDINADFV